MILGIFLAISSMIDIWRKKVYLVPVVVVGLMGLIVQIVNPSFTWRTCTGGILLGCCLLIAAKISGEAIGYGDGASVIVVGIWMGFSQTVEILLIALIMAAIFSSILLLVRKVGKKHTIPFIPFLFAAYLLVQLLY